MSVIDGCLRKYAELVRLPWADNIAGQERVWMLVYPPTQELRLRAKLTEFEIETKAANHGWDLVDLTDAFATWMSELDYRNSFFEHPEDLTLMLPSFGNYLSRLVTDRDAAKDPNAIVALMGLGSLFGIHSVSALLDDSSEDVQGRLLAFFPGVRESTNYRLLDAKDGWSYLAVAIDCTEDGT